MKIDTAFNEAMELYPDPNNRVVFIERALCSIRTIVEIVPNANSILTMNTYGYLEIGEDEIVDKDEVVSAVMPADISLKNTRTHKDRSLGLDELSPEQLRKLLVAIVDNAKQAIYDQQHLRQ